MTEFIDKEKLKEAILSGRETRYPYSDEEETWIQVDKTKWKELGL